MNKAIQRRVAACLVGTGLFVGMPALVAIAQPANPVIHPAAKAVKPNAAAAGIRIAPNDAMPNLMARSAILIEAKTGNVLYERNKDERRYPASTTKIMTLILALEKGNLDDMVTVGPNAVGIEGSSLYLEKGDKMPLRELLTGMMMQSGNDATVAVAEHIAGSVPAFAKMMTDKAREIGAVGTNFVNAHGLPDDNHYTTAHDLARITAYGYSLPEFESIVSVQDADFNWLHDASKHITSENKLLWQYRGGNGVKTGYTERAGRCVVSAAKRDGVQLIAVVLDDPVMWTDAYAMLDYGFAHTRPSAFCKAGEELAKIKVADARINEMPLVAARDSVIGTLNDENPKLEKKIEVPDKISAPVKKGDVVGKAICYVDGNVVDRVDLLAAQDAAYHTFWSDFTAWITKLMKGLF
ncbi:D-alanyl-D-alanine carboxypeptidase family protein [Selenomonas sp.]|uniref:D-alanyl-D-alanine carboxypeptidase family protein n=1 Tax=Selenomonas sp. TaxID=2053611 RepID=UPI0025E86EF9|nr:D-alanyl-D-alanine carboxypeptidase family protein [Selenomonas sp.]